MISKVFKTISYFSIIFKELFMLALLTILAKDPCKKCLVSPCCIDKCEKRMFLENFILRGDTLKRRKLIAWLIIFYFTCYIPLAVIVIIRGITN